MPRRVRRKRDRRKAALEQKARDKELRALKRDLRHEWQEQDAAEDGEPAAEP
jgi:hypothetical protein